MNTEQEERLLKALEAIAANSVAWALHAPTTVQPAQQASLPQQPPSVTPQQSTTASFSQGPYPPMQMHNMATCASCGRTFQVFKRWWPGMKCRECWSAGR